MRVPGLPINVGVDRLALVDVAHGVGTVLEGVSVAVDRAFGAVRLLGVLVGGWNVGATKIGGHDGYAVVSWAFKGLLVARTVNSRVEKKRKPMSLTERRWAKCAMYNFLWKPKRRTLYRQNIKLSFSNSH
jgi:hypothetical protein